MVHSISSKLILFPNYCILITLSFITPLHGFIPDALAGISSPTSVFHSVMTRKALMTHSVNFLKEFRFKGTSVWDSQVSLGDDPSPKELFRAIYGFHSDPEPFEDVMDQMSSDVASVDHDKDTKSDPKWHFDAERLEQGREGLLNEIEIILKLIRSNQFEIGRQRLGKMIHPLQDFYSHSNWIELGQTAPLHELINRDYIMPIPVANPNFQTCSNCERGFTEKIKSFLLTFSVVAPIGLGALGGSEQNIYKCLNNIEVHKNLTSGFYTNQYDEDGERIEKKPGKCSHGGALDITSALFATGGINKDMKNYLFSPHYYLHEIAATMAMNATVDLFNLLRRRVDNDLKWAQFLQLSPGPSLAFVVDICPSMSQYVPMINRTIMSAARQNAANHGVNGLKQTFIIAAFNDEAALEPEIGETQEDLNKIIDRTFKFYEQECRGDTRMLYGAIQKAALKSGIGGYLFVTTDGFPGDYYLEPWVTSTVRNKQLRFKMVLANQMSTIYLARSAAIARGEMSPEEEEIARTKDGLGGLRKLARDNGGSVRYVAQASDAIMSFESGTKNQDRPAHVIVAQDNKNRAFRVPVDPTVQQLEMSVTATSGAPPRITALDQNGVPIRVADDEYTKGINYNVILTPVPPEAVGNWTVRVTHLLTEESDIRPHSEYLISIRAKTDLKFTTSFLFDADLKTLHPGTQGIGRQRPVAGQMLVLEIVPQNRSLAANLSFDFVEFRTTQWDILSRFRIERSILMGKSFYAAVVIPNQPFHIRLSGAVNDRYPFIRTDPTEVEPSTLQLETFRPKLNSTDKQSSKPSNFESIVKSLQHSLGFKVKFTVANHGLTNGLFKIKIDDSANAVADYQPRTVIIGSGASITGYVFLEIPQNQDLVVTELTLQVNGMRTLTSNSLTSYITLVR